MADQQNLEEKYRKAAGIIVRAGMVPFQVTPTLVEIVKYYLDGDDIDFIIKNFATKTTLSHDEMRASAGMADADLEKKINPS